MTKRVFASAVLTIAGLVLWAGALHAGGKEIYAAKCKMCHGADGKGNAAIGAPAFNAANEATWKTTIRSGKGKMPTFGADKISDADLDAVIAHIKTLK